MDENALIAVSLSHACLVLEWFNNDEYPAAAQLPSQGLKAVCDLLHSPTGFETFVEQIRDNVPNTAHHLEEIWMQLSLGAVVIINDNTKSEIDYIMKWLSCQNWILQ